MQLKVLTELGTDPDGDGSFELFTLSGLEVVLPRCVLHAYVRTNEVFGVGVRRLLGSPELALTVLGAVEVTAVLIGKIEHLCGVQ